MRIGDSALMPPVTMSLICVNGVMLIALWFCQRVGIDLNFFLGLHYWQAPSFKIYQFVSYMFMHGGFSHFFFNMFALWMFGTTIERTWGAKRYLIYYFVCGLGAALVQEIVWGIGRSPEVLAYYGDYLITVGASGAIFGILLAFGMLYPNAPLYIMFIPVPIKAKWMVIGYGIMELFAGVSQTGDNVAHFAHLGGMIFGYLLIMYWRKRDKKRVRDGVQEFF